MRDSVPVQSRPASAHPPIQAVIATLARQDECAILDSAGGDSVRGRFTIAAFNPARTLVGRLGGEDPFQTLRGELQQTSLALGRPPMDSPDLPEPARIFPGGWIGYFAYEAGRYVERLPSKSLSDIKLPIARFSLFDTAAIHDALTGRWTLVAVDLPCLTGRPPVKSRLNQLDTMLQEAFGSEVTVRPASPVADPTHSLTHRGYEAVVERALNYIAAGDIYQVNLARRETYILTDPSVDCYLRLRQTNPASYAAFLKWREPADSPVAGEAAVLSSSPELFLQLRGREVLTRPIKGTRPRSTDPTTDRRLGQELAASPKDRAELAMIVDLERNDLGRVCEFGSIRVASAPGSPAYPYAMESHPTVHHLVADVTGRLAEGRDATDLVRACFPGGSITGAPKVRAMEIIDELEPVERSVYTGVIGYFSLTGDMTLNIAIRTLIIAGGRLHLYTGGGIVADSRPADEYRETQAKALGMHRALGCPDIPEPAFAQEYE
ncbi:MAG TPA: anthranilate synthase component I family protein [Phycisphaerae bacterium]|nr:anthranilate synthase component I family protein [Phycisphaerae bacterium]